MTTFDQLMITEKQLKNFFSKIREHGPKVINSLVLEEHPELKGTRCHIWEGSTATFGYGQFYCGTPGRLVPPHKVAYMLFIMDSLEDDRLSKKAVYTYYFNNEDFETCHKCDTKLCVNPIHLFMGTHEENMLDSLRKGKYAHQKDNEGFRHSISIGMSHLTRVGTQWMRF